MRYLLSHILFVIVLGIINCSYSLSAQTSIENTSKIEAIAPEIENKIQSLVKNGNLPSLQVAVVSKDQIIWSKAFGEGTAIDFLYLNGSVQKVFDATAILQLYESGLIELNKDVNNYLPFSLRHPQYPNIPITTEMLLSHRSGLDCPTNQFEWDTENVFSPEYRRACAKEIEEMSLEEYLIASLTTDGLNYHSNLWKYKPGSEFYYSLIAYPLLRYIIERVSGQTYPEYMKEHIFEPLGMSNSGFNSSDFEGRHAVPFTRIDNKSIELPIWNGKGYMMRTNAEDMAKFMIAHINEGNYQNFQLLKPETIALMQEKHSHGKDLFHIRSKCPNSGYGLGIFHYKNDVLGHGGSTPGFQSLWSFQPSSQTGYIILTNTNGILGGKKNFNSVWATVSSIENVLRSELGFPTNLTFYLIGIVITGIIISSIILLIRRKKRIKKEDARN